MSATVSGSSDRSAGSNDTPTSSRREMSVGSMPRSFQSGLCTFMGVSMNTQGLPVANENS